jgi:hypothetical protein
MKEKKKKREREKNECICPSIRNAVMGIEKEREGSGHSV